MRKVVLVFTFLLIALASCQNDGAVGAFNYEKDTPVWLKEKIDDISSDHSYYGTKVHRYKWTGKLIYHFLIPISSCAYCELYNHNGEKLQLTENEFFNFTETKKDKVLIWEWSD